MKFKNKKAEDRFIQMTVTAQNLAKEMCEWAWTAYQIELIITETWTTGAEDIKLSRESDTHRTGRAFDIRTKGLPDWFQERFLGHFRFLYEAKIGAVGKNGPCLIVDRPHGSGPHWHVQIRRGLK
jgi:hypothetical protein